MKMLFIAERYPPAIGGVAVSADRTTKTVARLGHDVHALVLARELPAGQVESETVIENLTLHRFGPSKNVDFTHAASVKLP